MRLAEIRRTTHRHTAANQTNHSRKSWKSTPRTVANVSFSWNKYEQRLNNIKKTFFTLNRDKLKINLGNSEGKHAYRPPSWIFLCFSLWPLYSLSLDRAFETVPQAYSSMKFRQHLSLRASSPFGEYREKYTRERRARGDATAGGGEEKGMVASSPFAGPSQLRRSLAFSRGSLRSPK